MENEKMEVLAQSRSYVFAIDGQTYRMSVTEKGKMCGFIYLSSVNGADTISRTSRFDEIGNGENKISVAFGADVDKQVAKLVSDLTPDITPKAEKKVPDFSKMAKKGKKAKEEVDPTVPPKRAGRPKKYNPDDFSNK